MQSSVPCLPGTALLCTLDSCLQLKNLQSTDWLVVSSLSNNNSDCHCPASVDLLYILLLQLGKRSCRLFR